MPGTKQRRRNVAHGMSNATRKRPAAKQTRRVKNAQQKTTSVIVPMVVGWVRPEHLDVVRGNQQLALRAALRDARKLKASLSMQVHGPKCPWSIVLWPRASECASEEVDEVMSDAIERRDNECTCTPLIMYTGAMA